MTGFPCAAAWTLLLTGLKILSNFFGLLPEKIKCYRNRFPFEVAPEKIKCE